MTEIILKTGWKHWDKYLSKFVGKKINCLDIGSYTGDSTCWMLNNLCSNPYSRVFSVDTWEGSPEYTNYTNEIENKFDKAIEKTNRKDQHVKMKMTSSKALIKLKEFGFIIFDFIFIDASHEAKDVITDAILSWDILNEEGILIFDDYKWDKLKEEHFRPKLAIDAFVATFKPQLKTLYMGYQYIIEKINIRDYAKPELEDYYKLVDRINKYKYEKFTYLYEDIIEENINFKLELSNEIEDIKLVPQINKNINNYDLLGKIFNINTHISNAILNKQIDNNIIKNITQFLNLTNDDILLFTHININLYDYIRSISNNDTKIFINHSLFNNEIFNMIYNIMKLKYKIKVSFNNLIIDNFEIYNELLNKEKKYDYIFFGYNKLNNDNNNIKIKYIILVIYISLAINMQKPKGILLIYIPYFINQNIVSQSIYLLKKYYKSVILTNLTTTNFGTNYIIKCTNFLNVIDQDKIKLNELIKEIYLVMNNNNINSFLLLDNNKYINDVNIIINNKYKSMVNTLKLYNDIYNFSNNKYKLQILLFTKIITNIISYTPKSLL
jgi:predicted O-methyltransferase YrrM